HLSAACLWAGGLVQLLLLRERRRDAFVRFARLAPVLIGVLLAAGIYLSVLRLPALDDLWTQRYGVILLVKISLGCVALAGGAFRHFVVRPRLERPRTLAWLPRSLAGESAVGMAVLLVAAVLVDSKPPPQGATVRPVAAAPVRSLSSQLAK